MTSESGYANGQNPEGQNEINLIFTFYILLYIY